MVAPQRHSHMLWPVLRRATRWSQRLLFRLFVCLFFTVSLRCCGLSLQGHPGLVWLVPQPLTTDYHPNQSLSTPTRHEQWWSHRHHNTRSPPQQRHQRPATINQTHHIPIGAVSIHTQRATPRHPNIHIPGTLLHCYMFQHATNATRHPNRYTTTDTPAARRAVPTGTPTPPQLGHRAHTTGVHTIGRPRYRSGPARATVPDHGTGPPGRTRATRTGAAHTPAHGPQIIART